MNLEQRVDDEGLLVLHAVDLTDVTFPAERIRSLGIGVGSRLVRCDLRGLRLEGGGFGSGSEISRYEDCVFDGSRLVGTLPGRATFVRCSFRGISFRDVFCQDAEFVDCVFSGSMEKVVFNAKPTSAEQLGRVKNVYRGNDFTHVEMFDVTFRGGVDLDLQKLPRDPRLVIIKNAGRRIERAFEFFSRMPDGPVRRDVEMILELLMEECENGQDDLLVSREVFGENAMLLIEVIGDSANSDNIITTFPTGR